MAGHSHHHEHGPGCEHDHGHAHAAAAPLQFTDPAQESLYKALQSSFYVLFAIMVALVIAYILSGVFRVQPGEQGLIVRMGVLKPVEGDQYVLRPGLHFALPDPFDEKLRLTGAIQSASISSFCFQRRPEDVGKPLAEIEPLGVGLTPGVDGAMLTGDMNLSHGIWTVEYEIVDGARFVLNVGESLEALRPLLLRLAEDAVVRTVATRRVEEVTRTNREEVRVAVQERLQAQLDALESGVKIKRIDSETIEPATVRQAFLQVTAAQSEEESVRKAAERQKNEILNDAAGPGAEALLAAIDAYGAAQAVNAPPETLAKLRGEIDAQLERAQGQVSRVLDEARARANEIRETVRRELEEFNYYLPAYRQDPGLTTVRLWVQMRDAVLGSKQNELFFVPRTDLDILTNRDPMKAIEADIESFRKRTGRGQAPPGP